LSAPIVGAPPEHALRNAQRTARAQRQGDRVGRPRVDDRIAVAALVVQHELGEERCCAGRRCRRAATLHREP
jgi:hypothetical protein